jgi:mannose-6-phosphate isomerase-like protein (cupin superfamily)
MIGVERLSDAIPCRISKSRMWRRENRETSKRNGVMRSRRVVSGTNSEGQTCVKSDGHAKHLIFLDDYPGVEIEQVWFTDGPDMLDTSGDESTTPANEFYPPLGGTRFMRITYPCGFGAANPESGESAFARLFMHQTSTVDYGVILEGELTLVLEDGSETVLRAGNTMVQNGVRHGWRNRGTIPAIGLFVLVGCEEKEE